MKLLFMTKEFPLEIVRYKLCVRSVFLWVYVERRHIFSFQNFSPTSLYGINILTYGQRNKVSPREPYNNNFIFGHASKLRNTDTVRLGGDDKTLWSSCLPPSNRLLSNTLNEHAHYRLAQTSRNETKEQNIALTLLNHACRIQNMSNTNQSIMGTLKYWIRYSCR